VTGMWLRRTALLVGLAIAATAACSSNKFADQGQEIGQSGTSVPADAEVVETDLGTFYLSHFAYHADCAARGVTEDNFEGALVRAGHSVSQPNGGAYTLLCVPEKALPPTTQALPGTAAP
jgi:hypothetical protein